MGFDKLLAPLVGRKVIAHSLAAFARSEVVSEIILVGRAEQLAEYEAISEAPEFGKITAVIPGGARRQDSVRCGLAQVNAAAKYVAVHDAARPLVRPETIARTFALAREHGGAACATPVIDTLKRVDHAQVVIGGVARADLFAVQTPQIFRRDLLENAYRHIFERDLEVTDEISAVEEVGGKVVLWPNDEPNFKITYPADLPLADFILRQRA